MVTKIFFHVSGQVPGPKEDQYVVTPVHPGVQTRFVLYFYFLELGIPYSYTVEEKSLCTICSVWSKISLITGSVSGAGADPPTCKMRTFFLYVPDTN